MKKSFILTFCLIKNLFLSLTAQERHGMGANFSLETIGKTPLAGWRCSSRDSGECLNRLPLNHIARNQDY